MTVTAESIAVELGMKRVGRAWRGACLLCGGSNRFQIQDGRNRPLVWCWGGCHRTAIIAELRRRNLWPQSDWTPEQKRDFAQQKARDAADLVDARRFANVAHILAEQALEALGSCDPQRAVFTRLLAALRSDNDSGMLATFREWRATRSEMTAALVKAGANHVRRLSGLLEFSLLPERGTRAV